MGGLYSVGSYTLGDETELRIEGGTELKMEFGNDLSRKVVTELKAVIEPKSVNDTGLSEEEDTELSQKSETKLSLESYSELSLEGETELASVLASLNREDWMHYMDKFSPTRSVETHSHLQVLKRHIVTNLVCRKTWSPPVI